MMQILNLNIDRGNFLEVFESKEWDKYKLVSLTATLHVIDSLFAPDSPKRNDSKVVLRFDGIRDLEFNGFNTQNPIIWLVIHSESNANPDQNLFAVDWGGTGNTHEVSFKCEHIEVVSVEAISSRI